MKKLENFMLEPVDKTAYFLGIHKARLDVELGLAFRQAGHCDELSHYRRTSREAFLTNIYVATRYNLFSVHCLSHVCDTFATELIELAVLLLWPDLKIVHDIQQCVLVHI